MTRARPRIRWACALALASVAVACSAHVPGDGSQPEPESFSCFLPACPRGLVVIHAAFDAPFQLDVVVEVDGVVTSTCRGDVPSQNPTCDGAKVRVVTKQEASPEGSTFLLQVRVSAGEDAKRVLVRVLRDGAPAGVVDLAPPAWTTWRMGDDPRCSLPMCSSLDVTMPIRPARGFATVSRP